jgi:DNA polymerase III delta prime subunit
VSWLNLFSEQYRPKTLSEVIGQGDAITELRRWGESWNNNNPAYKSAVLYGPPGVGKSSAATALASDLDWDILEVDTSDTVKTVKEFKELLENAVYTSPFKNKVLILLEDCDSYTKNFYKVIEDLIEKSVNPWILLLNDEYAVKKITSYFRDNSFMLRFSALRSNRILEITNKVMTENNVIQPKLDDLIRWSHGDVRWVLNNITVLDPVPKRTDDIIFTVVHDIFRGNWKGDTHGIDIDLIWYAVKANINDFYDTVYDQPLAEYVASIDMILAHHRRLFAQGDTRSAFRLRSYVIGMLRLLPLHQKTTKIMLPKSDINYTKDKQRLEFAHAVHCSYKKAGGELDYMDQMFEVWKKAPKIKIKPTEQVSTTKNLFSYADDSPVDGVGG